MKSKRIALICYGLADVVKASPELAVQMLHEAGDACMAEHEAEQANMFVPHVPPPVPRPRKRKGKR